MTAKLSQFEKMMKARDQHPQFSHEIPESNHLAGITTSIDEEVPVSIRVTQGGDSILDLDQELGAALARILTKIFL